MNNRIIKILIVEDEPVIRNDIIKKVSSNSDFSPVEILEAGNGMEALELMNDSIDVVLTDVNMPVMNGIELIEQLRNEYPNVLTVVISGYDDFKYVKSAMKLGAVDYILKPVSDDIIRNLMTSIIKLICEHSLDEGNDFSQLFNKGNGTGYSYYEFIVNLGNLHIHATDKDKEKTYHDLLNGKAFKERIQKHLRYSKDLKIIPEPIENRILVVFSESSSHDFVKEISNIYEDLKVFFYPVPVSIAYDDDLIQSNDLYMCTHKLRNLMDSNLIACSSNLFHIDEVTPFSKRSGLNMLKARFIQLINDEEYGKCKSEFVSYFNKSVYREMPQLLLESILCDAVFFNYGTFVNLLTQEDANTLNEEIYNICSYEEDYDTLLIKAASFMCDFYSRYNASSESGESVVDYLLNYINEHFSAQFSLEEFAEKFSFNSTYLIRLFRNKTGTTPNKYVITLRINEAKRMLEESPELSVKQIAEICGYEDQHYFSRLFKAQCGVNPTTYRESL